MGVDYLVAERETLAEETGGRQRWKRGQDKKRHRVFDSTEKPQAHFIRCKKEFK